MKQINIRVDDKMATAIYAKLANQKYTMQSLVQGFFETWLNETEDIKENKSTNDSNLEQTLLNQEIMAKLNQLEKNQDDLIERLANDSTNDSTDDSNNSDMIAKVESIEIENLQNKTKLENLEIEFIEFKKTIKNQLADLKNDHVRDHLPSHEKLKEIGNKEITRQALATLLNKSPRTLEKHTKDIENYTKNLIGIAYKYDVKTRLYYPQND